MSNSGSVSVAAQAELLEKEKTVAEHQQRLESLRDTVKTMATRQVTLKRTERRCRITVGELTKLKPEHVVYQGVGRAFMRTPVNKLIDLNNEEVERCEAEESRLSHEKQRTSELVTKEEGELRRAVEEFRAVLMVVQATQSRSQQSA
ncbi:putative Prefoldin subunit [Leishmania naiffi]|uniref:Prefoldin subunit n=2 Tax=Viannia TaxID=37616 RepID=A0AAW3A320_9TRYP